MIIRPTAKFVFDHPAHLLALGFGTGIAPIAPGTVGTLLGFPLYWLLAKWFTAFEMLAVTLGLFLAGIWACGKTGRDLGIADHSSMNWDEIVAIILVLAIAPPGIGWQVFAFFAFRFFDIVKPPPIRHLDRTLKGGFGVMFDDIVAAFYTLIAMAIAKHLLA